ncbi:MAG: type II secretion system protein J, partial [Bdellovibrionales bacterium]
MILNNQRGNSLIQVMIATAIMLVVALGTADLISNQNKEVKALTERLQISETKTLLSQILINSSYCSCLFRGRTFNSTTKTWTPAITSLPSSYTNIPAFPAACTASASNLVPPVGTVMPGTGHMKVES